MRSVTCGTTHAYQQGCRCDLCRVAKVASNRESRLRLNPPKPIVAIQPAEWARLYREMLERGEWEQGVHRRRVTVLLRNAGGTKA